MNLINCIVPVVSVVIVLSAAIFFKFCYKWVSQELLTLESVYVLFCPMVSSYVWDQGPFNKLDYPSDPGSNCPI